MKRTISPIHTLALAGSLMCAAHATQLEITPTLTKKIYNYSDHALQDGKIFYGIRGALYLKPEVALEAGIEASNTNKMGDGGDTDVERGTLTARLEPFARKKMRVQPYLSAGMGYEKVHREIPGVSSQAFYTAGGGVKIRMSPKTDLFTEARLIHKIETKDDDIMGTIGVGYAIGRSTPAAPCTSSAQEQKKPLSLAEFAQLCKTRKKWIKPAKITQGPIPAPAPAQKTSATPKSTAATKAIVVKESYPKDLKPEEIAALEKAQPKASAQPQTATLPATTPAPTTPAKKAEIKPVLAQSAPAQPITFEGPLVYDDNDFVSVCKQNQKAVLEDLPQASAPVHLDTITLPSCPNDAATAEPTPQSTETSGYFIQLAALRHSSPAALMKRLKEQNIPSTVRTEGTTKILLAGPFSSKAEAKRHLSALRSISKDAYIRHL